MTTTPLPFLVLAIVILPGSCFYLLLSHHNDNYHFNPAISPFPNPASFFLVSKSPSLPDLPPSLPSNTKRHFPLPPSWLRHSRLPF